jgi:hypothetical protein
MRAKCVMNRGLDLGPHRTGMRYIEEHVFDVEVGSLYDVYAMCMFRDGLHVLVVTKWGRPNWLPMGLFDVIDSKIPAHWEFAYFPSAPLTAVGRPGFQAVWGYPAATRPDHLDGLVERDKHALEVFEEERQRLADQQKPTPPPAPTR